MKTSNLGLLYSCFTAFFVGINARNIEILDSSELHTPNPLLSQFNRYVNEPSSNSICLGSVFLFKANVTNIETKYVVSSKVILDNLSWRVILKKQILNKTDMIAVLLESASGENSSWSVEAQANFHLYSKQITGSNLPGVCKTMLKHKYTNLKPTHGVEDFVTWDQFKNYMNENEINLKIDISTSSLSLEKPTDIEQIATKLHIMLNNVSNLNATSSPEIMVRGIKWRVHFERINDSLAMYLDADDKKFDMHYYYRVEADFQLLSFDKSVKSVALNFSHNYRFGSYRGGFNSFVRWNEFVDATKKYVAKEKASFLVQFNVDEPKSLWDFDG